MIGQRSFTELEEITRHPEDDKRSTIITTRDLIDWSYQIARGMNYLAKNMVFNILLSF